MRKGGKILAVVILMLLACELRAQDYQVRMAFIGNSISAGFWLPEGKSFPDQLAVMLDGIYGDTCYLHNYALSGRTMFKEGDSPFWREPELQQALDFAPNMVFIMLGTNDSKSWNWDMLGYDRFVEDYVSMVDTFLNRNPHTTFILGYPPPAFDSNPDNVGGISDSVIHYGVIPAVDSVIEVRGGYVMDFYTGMAPYGNLFFDKIHPYVEGAAVMAEQLRDRMIELDIVHTVETGLSFITAFNQSSEMIGLGEAVKLSWETTSYDSIMLNEQRVDGNGITIYPTKTTNYCLKTIGAKSVDSVNFSVEVYEQVFTSISLVPKTKITAKKDTVYLRVAPLDQIGRKITTRDFDVNWTIYSGDGTLLETNDSSACYVPGDSAISTVRVSLDDRAAIASIYVMDAGENPVEAVEVRASGAAYPNPFCDRISVPVPWNSGDKVLTSVYNIDGKLIYERAEQLQPGEVNVLLEASAGLASWPEGLYLISVSNGSEQLNHLVYRKQD